MQHGRPQNSSRNKLSPLNLTEHLAEIYTLVYAFGLGGVGVAFLEP